MRFRLGLLQDTAVIEKELAKEAAEAQAKKHRHDIPTAKTEAQAKAAEAKESRHRDHPPHEDRKPSTRRPKIRPLSEAKAIDLGANFASETFLFTVGVGLILFENWRRNQKETSRREDVADRLNELEERDRLKDRYYGEALGVLEKELISLEGKKGILQGTRPHILPPKPQALKEKGEEEEETVEKSWLGWLREKTIGAREADTVRVTDEKSSAQRSTLSAAEPRSTSPSNQPTLSIVERVRDRIHPRDLNAPNPDQQFEIPAKTPSSTKSSR